MKDKKNKVTAMAMATTIAVTTMAPLPTATVYAQELDKAQIEARINEENKEKDITKVEAPKDENKGAVENNKETSNVENEKTEESTSNKENNQDKVQEEEKDNAEETNKVENQDNKENTDENTKVEDQEKKEETEIKDSNEKNEALDNAENKSESEKIEKETLEKVEEVEDKDLSRVEENKESGEKERAGEVAIDETNFPDAVFKKYVSDNFDNNNDGVLSEDEINEVTSINVWNKYKISDLTGIEYFENLEYLDCRNTKITSLDLSNNTALTDLDCNNTGITSLDVSNNTALEYLDCRNIKITSLDLSNNTALEYLDCNNTGITSLDLSQNTSLIELYCISTGITSLDVSNNTALTDLYCSGTGITSLDVSNNTTLKYLLCYDTGITSLDVSNNTVLEYLVCYDTGITSLDVSNNTALEYLDCSDTEITSLDVSQNVALRYLSCSNNENLTSLDVSNNTSLIELECSRTGITSLDLSKNIALEYLVCVETPLIGLDIGKNDNLMMFNNDYNPINNLSTTTNLTVTSESFNINELGLEESKIKNLSGAELNGDIMTITSINTPITYEYDCGSSKNGAMVLEVTLNLEKGDRQIEINSLDKDYDGNPIKVTKDNCTITVSKDYIDKVTLSDGDVEFTYYKKNSAGAWEKIQEAREAGEYKVVANLKEIDYWKEAVGEKEFKISQATNVWTDKPSIEGWTYGETPKKPRASAQFGDVEFSYSNSENGNFESVLPTEAGRWYVKAEVIGNDNYTGISDIKEFEIAKAKPTYSIPQDIKATYGQTLKDIKLPEGFSWVDDTQSVGNVGANKFMATYTPSDTNNYEVVNDIEVTVDVTQAINNWTQELSIEGWTYGEAPKKPTASAQFGEVKFSYSNKKTRNYTEEVPTEAGTWYVKAEVIGNDNYTGISEIKEFEIKKAVAPELILPTNLSAVQDDLLSTIELPKGWIWVNSNEKVTVNNEGYKARLTVDDKNYDYSKVDGYNSKGHYVERTLTVSVSQGKNEWSVIPSIKGWTYGESENAPVGSANHGEVIFTYSNSPTGKFESAVPSNAGTWYMKATVLATDEYTGLNEIVEFKIEKAINKWTQELSIEGWTYGEASNNPTALAKFGDVEFTYSNSKDGEFSSTTPTEAGIWYVEAEVIGNDNYAGISDIKEFEIKKAVATEIVLPNNLSAVQDTELKKVILPEGWTWVNSNEKVTVNNKEYKARLTVDDKNYDYSKVDGYNSKGHYVERTLTVSVSQGKNEWSVIPSIKGWTYGESENAPVGSANHGEVIFTYSNSPTGKFESAVPSNAGTWYMKATVLATDEYTGLNEIVEFKIEKATPKFEVPNNLTATLGQTLKDIKLPEGFEWNDATQSLGKVGINKFMATYTPKDTLNYNVVENIEITVTVSNLATPEVIEPSNLSAVQNDLLSTVELPEGWTWVNPNEKVTVNNNGYKARLKVDDEKYDYSKVEGYNKDGHYVERTLTVSVSANRNEWSVIPSIKGWTYGETENTPVGSAEHGSVIFTYSNSQTGKFESAIPSNAGTWYMKATVLATDEYTGLNEIIEFTITPKSSEDIKIPEINEDINIEDLVITVGDKTLVNGVDYDITEKQEGNTVTVTITFKGNYTGTITKTYEVEDSGNNKPPIDDDNNNDNNNGDDNNNDNDDNNGDDNNDNDNNGNNNNGDDNNGNDNDDSNNNSGNGGSNNNNNGNNNSSNGNNNSGSTGKDEVIVKPTLPQTGEKNTLGLWGLVLTITGGAIAFITGKS
ncbi:leucine-rich repeat domain-containing protein, partial [uncultured Clostridium sp.]|uniref:leucine-rich repeat domain-containing protein n=3 Tax=uncultured Clostridium sp. TaxID=59620 RepID=UPI0026F38CF1